MDIALGCGIDQVGQNTSDVRIRLALLNQGWTFASYQCSGYVDGFGQRIDYSGSPAMLNRNSEIQLIDRTITVRHADDGAVCSAYTLISMARVDTAPET